MQLCSVEWRVLWPIAFFLCQLDLSADDDIDSLRLFTLLMYIHCFRRCKFSDCVFYLLMMKLTLKLRPFTQASIFDSYQSMEPGCKILQIVKCIFFFKLHKIFFPNWRRRKTYLSKLLNVFVQTANWLSGFICWWHWFKLRPFTRASPSMTLIKVPLWPSSKYETRCGYCI